MNKSKSQVPIRARKKMNKEIRSAVPILEPKITSDHIKPAALLSTLPPKVRKKEASLLQSFEKNMEIKHKKRTAKHSKRTTTGLVGRESSPHHVHIENERWIKSLKNQTAVKNKILSRKLSKRK